jgi:hypothetical protein
MKPDAFAGAKTAGFPKGRGQILGTGLGRVERWTYAAKATKKAICWPFLKPSNRLELLTPPYHGGFVMRRRVGGGALPALFFLHLSRSGLLSHPLLEAPRAALR